MDDDRYLSIIIVCAKEGKKETFSISAQAWRPSTYERVHSSFVPLTTAAVAVTTQQLWPTIGRRPVVCYERHCIKQGGDGSLPSPVFRFIWQGGAALYRPLCSVLYSRGGRLCTVPCVRFYIAGGDGSLLCPVFGFIQQGGDGYLPSPVFGFMYRGDGSLPSPVFGFT